MRWTGFLFFVTLQREIPFGEGRETSRETYTDIVNTLAEVHESWRKKDQIQEENNETNTNSTITEEKSENKVPLEVTLKRKVRSIVSKDFLSRKRIKSRLQAGRNTRKDARVNGRDVKSHDRCVIKLEDIRWKQSNISGTDIILSIPFLPSPPPLNEVRSMK